VFFYTVSSSASLLANPDQSLSPMFLDVLGQMLGRMLVVIVVFTTIDGVEPNPDIGSELCQAFVPFLEKRSPSRMTSLAV
jgi:hypothetical protein